MNLKTKIFWLMVGFFIGWVLMALLGPREQQLQDSVADSLSDAVNVACNIPIIGPPACIVVGQAEDQFRLIGDIH